MPDIIIGCTFTSTRAFIKISDGSTIQFGIDSYLSEKLQSETTLLKNAEMTEFINDPIDGYFRLGYLPANRGIERFLEVRYNPSEQSTYELSLKRDFDRN